MFASVTLEIVSLKIGSFDMIQREKFWFSFIALQLIWIDIDGESLQNDLVDKP